MAGKGYSSGLFWLQAMNNILIGVLNLRIKAVAYADDLDIFVSGIGPINLTNFYGKSTLIPLESVKRDTSSTLSTQNIRSLDMLKNSNQQSSGKTDCMGID